jgi:hypothetical protein
MLREKKQVKKASKWRKEGSITKKHKEAQLTCVQFVQRGDG